MENIRIAYFGTPAFAATVLEECIKASFPIVCVVSQPDKPVGRKKILTPCPVKEVALKYGIPVEQPANLKSDYQGVLAYQPDLILTCAYGQMVPKEVLQAPKYGCLNIHPSPLPKYRGGAPIQRAIMNGDASTEVDLMEMVEAMDAGKVFVRVPVTIGKDETGSELFARLADIAAKMIAEALPKYLEGKYPGEKQDDSKAVIARNIAKEEEKVSFGTEELPALYNHIRALTVVPGAYGICNGKRYKFLETRMELISTDEAPGMVLGYENGAIRIACKNGILNVFTIQPEGKAAMDAKSFSNGGLHAILHQRFE